MQNVTNDSATAKVKKKGFSSKVVIVVAIVVGILIGTLWGLTDDDYEKSVIDHKNESGAIISMNLEQFSKEFEDAYALVEKSAKFDDVKISLEDSWEKTTSNVDESGIAYDYYSTAINGIELQLKAYDNYISLVLVDFTPFKTANEIEFATILSTAAIIACSDMSVEKANDIFKYTGDGNLKIYQNGLLFYKSDQGYFVVRAASQSFVQAWNAQGISVSSW